MGKAVKKIANITSVTELAEGVFSMWIKDKAIADSAVPGQFLSLYSRNGNKLLPRPISICEMNKDEGTIRLVYRVVGEGTKEFSTCKAGETIEVMGPLGNGFPLERKSAILVGGGIGIPPMLELAKQLQCEKKIVLGYRDILFLNNEFESYGDVYISTEDGSVGTKGNVVDAIINNDLKADVIYACGPTPMLRGLKEYAGKRGIATWLSLEERMACGIGACLACICKTGDVDHHTNVNNKRICKDGPVFSGEEIEL
ncbi:MAG: dihydroorotate dehydrogenase electron transfer subunit [Anaerocolumna sp.]